MRLPLAPLLVLAALAGCVRTNATIIEELDRRAAARGAGDPALQELRDLPFPPRDEPQTVTLPLIEGRLPVVRASVNGTPIPLLVDTGTTHFWLSGPAARRADLLLLPGAAREILSPGYLERARVGVIDQLDLGTARFGRGAALISLREQQEFWYRHMPGPEYGILGVSVLGHYRVTFDFARRELRLQPHGQEPAQRPLLAPVEIGGRTHWFLVDSGATRMFLEPWLAEELGLISQREARQHASKAERAEQQSISMVRLESVAIVGRVFAEVKAGVVNTFGGATTEGGERVAGLLGPAGFGKLVWTVDFATRELTIEDA